MSVRKVNKGFDAVQLPGGCLSLSLGETLWSLKVGEVSLDLDNDEYEALIDRIEEGEVALLGRGDHRNLWYSDMGIYWADEDLTDEEVGLILWDRKRKSDNRLERLRKQRLSEVSAPASRRKPIPDDVKTFVWDRDRGRCARCGSEEELQFDHIIPVAKGGGASTENIQILCGNCNRQKSDSII